MPNRLGFATLLTDGHGILASGAQLEIYWNEKGALYARPANSEPHPTDRILDEMSAEAGEAQ